MTVRIESELFAPELREEARGDEKKLLSELERIADQKRLGEGKTAEVWPLMGNSRLCMKVIDEERLRNLYDADAIPPHNKTDEEFAFLEEAEKLGGGVKVPKPYISWRVQTESGKRVSALVMERIDGPSLKEVHEGSPLPPAFDARAFFEALRSFLALLHEAGIHHRDIAESNILVGKDGRPCLIDFGDSAREIAGESPYTVRDDFGRTIRSYPNDNRHLKEVEKRLMAKLSIDREHITG